ncbi:hypothetical protein BPY_20920 [Bifidobacterium psychraerophilum]
MVNQESITKQAAGKINAALETAGRSVKWLSDQSGTPYVTLRRQLEGKSSISIGQLATYADCLQSDPILMLPDSFCVSPQNLAA